MNTGTIIDNTINGYSLEDWLSFLEEDVKNAPNKIRLIEKMKNRMPLATYDEKVSQHNEGLKLINADISLIKEMLVNQK